MMRIAIGFLILGWVFADGGAVYAASLEAASAAAEKFDLPADRVDTLVKASPYAKLSADVYRGDIKQGEKVEGWLVLNDVRETHGFDGEFHATAYMQGEEIVVVFEGTRPPDTLRDVVTGMGIQLDSIKEKIASGEKKIDEGLQRYGENVVGGAKELAGDSKKIWGMLKNKDVRGALNIIKGTGKDVVTGGKILSSDASGGAKSLAKEVTEGLQQYGKDVAGGAKELKKDAPLLIDLAGDWNTNLNPLSALGISSQDLLASMFTSEIVANNPGKKITVAGHSKGGRLAQFSLLMNEGVSSGYVFNSAPLSLAAVWGGHDDELGRLFAKTISIRSKDDPLRRADAAALINHEGEIRVFNVGHSMEALADSLDKVSNFYLTLQTQIEYRNTFSGMHNQLTAINQGGSSHIGSAAYFMGRSPSQDFVRESRNTVAHIPTIRETSQVTNGFIIQAPVDIVLTWGAAPSDLDSHLTGPAAADGTRFHTSFMAQGDLNAAPNVMLYRDVTTGTGPEQTRINVVQPGVYRFYVHDYTNLASVNSTALSNSGAVVAVHAAGSFNLPEGNNLGAEVARVSVPTNQVGTVWQAFELDSRTGILNRVDQFRNISDPASVPFNQ